MPGLTPPPPPREVISSKEKSKYKFPPATLPCEFSDFFRGQAPPLPTWPHLVPPLNLSPFLQFPILYAGQDPLSGGCPQGWENHGNFRGPPKASRSSGAERRERALLDKMNNFFSGLERKLPIR